MKIFFVSRRKAKKFADVYRELNGDPDRDPSRWSDGLETWIVQSALRLTGRDPNIEIHLSDRFVPGEINIVHRDEARPFTRPSSCFTIVIRADRAPVLSADRVVVQNPSQTLDGSVFIPFWPQPGLIPRNPERKALLKVLAYQGRIGNLPKVFQQPSFASALNAMGVELKINTTEWHDYRDIDAVFAIRQDSQAMIASKPASKLINAWHGGVIPILGTESAYRAAGTPGLDYLEADTPESVLAVISRLRDDPISFERMLAAGARQAPKWSVNSVVSTWISALKGPLCPRSGEMEKIVLSRWSRQIWRGWREHRIKQTWEDENS